MPFYVFMVLVMVGSSNAVNLTDGLDGLAIGLMVIASGAMTALTYVSGQCETREYLDLARLPDRGELTIFCGVDGGREPGFSLVQLPSGGNFHGRRGLAGAGRRAGRGGGADQAGNAAASSSAACL